MECYGLDRFSEDIDLDCKYAKVPAAKFFRLIDHVSAVNGYKWHEGKNTTTVQKAFINYGDPDSPLKVEVSHRRTVIDPNVIVIKDGIATYSISELCRLKAAAYMSRDKIRDLYDLSFISEQYFDELNPEAKDTLALALEYKDVEQFDYLVRTQNDPLIDRKRLEDRFLAMMDRSGLLYEKHAPATTRVRTKDDLMQALAGKTEGMKSAGDKSKVHGHIHGRGRGQCRN